MRSIRWRLLPSRLSGVSASITWLLVVLSPGVLAQAEVKPVAGPRRTSVLMSLPPERADRVKTLMVRVKMANAQLEERLEQHREDLEAVYWSYRIDEARCRRLRQLIRQTQDQLLDLHHQFQLDLRRQLTPAEFDQLQREFAKGREEKLRAGKSQFITPEDKLKYAKEQERLKLLLSKPKPEEDEK
jgi:Spy/CpxP family protein refolding chaperone